MASEEPTAAAYPEATSSAAGSKDLLPQPQLPYLDSRTPSSITDQRPESGIADSTTILPVAAPKEEVPFSGEGEADGPPSNRPGRRRLLILALAALAVVILIVLVIILPVYFTVIKPKSTSSSSSSSSEDPGATTTGHSPRPTSTSSSRVTSGGDGSEITLADGSKFKYSNKFGGFWVSDPDNPYNDSARPNTWSPPLNEPWDYGKNRIHGVNIGGLFVLEPFISPALFQKYPGSNDEWSLSIAMAADTANGGLKQLETHYDTFITEKDIAEIAGAGLTWIRLPVAFWAIETWPGEPFLEKTSWKYIIRLFQWCRKYGIRVNLDLHALPGSANEYNHGGKNGVLNFMHGPMGMANAQRSLNIIRVITEFISQPEWKNVVPMFSVLNEPIIGTIGATSLRSFYVEVHRMMRDITGFGEGKGPYMVIHDSFQGPQEFAGFMNGADRLGVDTHPYFAFTGATTAATIDSGVGPTAGGPWPLQACSRYGTSMNDSRVAFGVTVAGEFSLAFQDCGVFLRGVGNPPTYQGDCTPWEDSTNWGPGVKAGLKQFAAAQMDSLGDYFFWTWKVGESQNGVVGSPLWSYKLGLENGWIPTDPRSVYGTCEALGQPGVAWDQTYLPWMTGGPGAGVPTDRAQYPWPPATIADGGRPNVLPQYTSTAPIVSLPDPTFTDSKGKAIKAGDGWFKAGDTTPAPTTIAGCTYPDAWGAEDLPVPPLCRGPGGPVATPEATTTEDSVTPTTTTTDDDTVLPTTTTTTTTTTDDSLITEPATVRTPTRTSRRP